MPQVWIRSGLGLGLGRVGSRLEFKDQLKLGPINKMMISEITMLGCGV